MDELHQEIPIIIDFLKNNSYYSNYMYNSTKTFTESVSILKELLVWFRREFPYYLKGCSHCFNKDNSEFAGILHPKEDEFMYKANVVEMSYCSNCSTFSRFPRYNNVVKVCTELMIDR